jgi:hypothetical protein
MKILYIAGIGRTGSTVVDQVLGAQPGLFSTGQLEDMWKDGVLRNWRCACGEPFASCPFWSAVRQSDPDLLTTQAAEEIVRFHDQTFRLRLMPRLWWSGGRQQILSKTPAEYLDRIARLYRAIELTSGCDTIVDSSKDPGYAHLLLESGAAESIEVIHLVRDPRAVAYSWTRRKVDPTSPGSQVALEPRSVALTARIWLAWNSTIERLGHQLPVHYRFLRYEDFVSDPNAFLRRLGLGDAVTHGESAPTVQNPAVWHTVAGNPSRMRSGPIVLRADEEWREKISNDDAFTVSMITAPLLRRYGYRFRFRTEGGSHRDT